MSTSLQEAFEKGAKDLPSDLDTALNMQHHAQ